jgi:hypothetical protein
MSKSPLATKEPIMIVQATSACLTLWPGQVSRLTLRAGTRVRGLRGTAWLTADGDARDIVLDPKDEWTIERDGQVLACALQAQGQALLQLDEVPRGAA